MPRGDRSGPLGMGPMTGRGAGDCAGYAGPGFANGAFGRGAGMGLGRGWGFGGRGAGFGRGFGGGGRGWRGRFGGFGSASVPYAMDPTAERESLENHANVLRAEMDAIQARLDALNASGQEEKA